jgi:hypothetical protein
VATVRELAPAPRPGTDVVRGQCTVGIMAPVPGDPNPEPAAHYCAKDNKVDQHPEPRAHHCGCGYVWDDQGNTIG